MYFDIMVDPVFDCSFSVYFHDSYPSVGIFFLS